MKEVFASVHEQKSLAPAPVYIIIFPRLFPCFTPYLISIWSDMHSLQAEYESGEGGKEKSNEKLNIMFGSLELVCLPACLFGVKGRNSH